MTFFLKEGDLLARLLKKEGLGESWVMNKIIVEWKQTMDSIIQDTPISGSFLSDHVTVMFNLKGSKSESSAKEVWFRKIKSINLR